MSGATWVTVLAGGLGSRFWPMSTPRRPKQLLPLVSDQPMLCDTLERIAAVAPIERTLVLTGAPLAGEVRRLLPALPPENLIAEPRPAGTTAALAWAALEIARRDGVDAVMVSVYGDWAIADVPRFQETLREAVRAAAKHHALVTVGVVPTRADPGLGYIEPGAKVSGPLRRVLRFIEKPDRPRAEALVAQGCLWNSGIFAWRVGDLLDEIRSLCPEVATAVREHGSDFDAFFAHARSIAIDTGVLERSGRVMVLPGDFGWSDVGTWTALREVRVRDGDGNAPAGPVLLRDARGNVVHAERSTVVLFGVSDLVVVATKDVTLVTTVERASDLKTLLDSLPREVRDL